MPEPGINQVATLSLHSLRPNSECQPISNVNLQTSQDILKQNKTENFEGSKCSDLWGFLRSKWKLS